MAYLYGILTESGTLDIGVADMTSSELSASLQEELAKVLVRAATMTRERAPRGAWEIISHSVVRIDRHLLVNFLVRRQTN